MLPAAALFKRQGANKGALASFLVTTPESGIDSISITYVLLDPIMTVVRPLAALVTGICSGIFENLVSGEFGSTGKKIGPVVLQTLPLAPQGKEGKPSQSLSAKVALGVRYGFVDVWGDIVVWFFLGLLLAAVITVYIPENLFNLVLGGGLTSMLAALVVGMPVYICATASTPVAAALLLKGASPGAVLVFLLAGPATNLTSLSVLIQILGKYGTLRYLLTIAVVSVIFGLGVDWLYRLLAIEPRAVLGEARDLLPESVKIGSVLLLISLSIWHFVERGRQRLLRSRYRHLVQHRLEQTLAGTAGSTESQGCDCHSEAKK